MSDKKSLDEVFDKLDSMMKFENELDDRCPITIWVPKNYKESYDTLQNKTKKKFVKFMREIFKSTIDKAQTKI